MPFTWLQQVWAPSYSRSPSCCTPHERLAYSAVFSIATTAASAVVRILVLLLGYHVLALVTVQTAVTLVGAVAMAWIVYARFLPRRLELDPAWWPALLRCSMPFALMGL